MRDEEATGHVVKRRVAGPFRLLHSIVHMHTFFCASKPSAFQPLKNYLTIQPISNSRLATTKASSTFQVNQKFSKPHLSNRKHVASRRLAAARPLLQRCRKSQIHHQQSYQEHSSIHDEPRSRTTRPPITVVNPRSRLRKWSVRRNPLASRARRRRPTHLDWHGYFSVHAGTST